MIRALAGLLAGAFFVFSGPVFAGQEVTLTDEQGHAIRDSRAYQGVVTMSVGTAYPAQRAVAEVCTVAGNVSVTFADGSVFVFPVVVGLQQQSFGVTAINTSGTTATCTYAGLK